MIKILDYIFFTIFISGFSFSHISAQNKDQKPNVLFIICDDLNDYEGVFGGHKQALTPNMDKLAISGVRFMNAQFNAPVCLPSRNSLFTGVYPHDSKDFGWTKLKSQPVLMNNKTMMQFFQENGYKTYGSGKLTHDHIPTDWNEWGMKVAHNYGPIYFDGTKNTANPSVPEPYRSIGAIDGSFGRLSDAGISPGIKGEKGWIYGQDGAPMRYINDQDRDLLQDEKHAQWAVSKLKEMEATNSQTPFFMGIGFVRPHTPLHVPDKYYDMFPLDKLELDKWIKDDKKDTYYTKNISNEDKGPRYYKTLLESYGGDRELALKHFLQAYLACVAFVDEQIGVILDGLNNSKFKNNTIVILTGDHGWQMGEKDYLFKNSPWEESARVPLIIKSPDTKANTKVEHPVSLVDIFPTLIDLASLKGDHKTSVNGGNLGGYSLNSFLEGKEKEWKGPNGALTIVGNAGITIVKEKQNYSYRTINWRYIRYTNGDEELYDHLKDPYEWKNLADDKKYANTKALLHREMNEIIAK
jgi:arylsulfatase A-like enzyme